MSVDLWIWLATAGAVLGLFIFDFYAHVKTPHEPTFKESAIWSTVYIVLALVFGVALGMVWGWDHGKEYFAGYVTEKSLSVDNLFVFLIIMTKFAVPRIYQQKVLLVGVAVALVLRTIFILLGAAAIAQFSWVFYLFGLFLIYTGVKLAMEKHDEAPAVDSGDSWLIRQFKKVVRTVPEYHDDKLSVKIDGKRFITPMLLVMLAIGSTDVVFALDSIPAIYGLTHEPYIVFTANAFALLGLRQLYFLIGGLLQRLIYLSQGLSAILVFIGAKLIIEALHANELSFINGGKPMLENIQISTNMSLYVILGILTFATVASLLATRGNRAKTEAAPKLPETKDQ